ncbi:Uncharacterized protein dnm_057530 [Desulfonema magnum]|uniref:Uncharacterized protein n=1 Tax=Desulfonema magnum TaxID=45655 RepID=A0A975GQ55_9BACT|nr:Uncharacterized protein dnm_057530 [Desulfonema magnum]
MTDLSPDLKHRSAFGETPEEALKEMPRAKAAWPEAAISESRPVPRPCFRPAIYQAA